MMGSQQTFATLRLVDLNMDIMLYFQTIAV